MDQSIGSLGILAPITLGTAPGTLEGAWEPGVPVWALLGVALYVVSVVLALAYDRRWHRIPILGPGLVSIDDRVSGWGPGHIIAGSVGLFIALSTLILLVGPQANFADPLAYYQAIEMLFEGGNPYAEPPVGLIVAYTGLFISLMAPFVALFGLAGTFIASAFVAAFFPITLWAASKAYVDERGAAYAGALGLVLPSFMFKAARWSSEEVYVALALTLGIFFLLTGKEFIGFAVAGILSIKFTAAIPVMGWIIERSPRASISSWFDGAFKRGLAYGTPYLVVFAISTYLWGHAYLFGVYWRQTVQRAASRLDSMNVFHLAGLAGWQPPSFTFFIMVAILLVALAYVLLAGPRDPVLTGGLLMSVTLLVITSASVSFIVWLLPFVLLYTLRYAGEDLLISPLFAVLLGFIPHLMGFAQYKLPPPAGPYLTGALSIVITLALLLVIHHTVRVSKDSSS